MSTKRIKKILIVEDDLMICSMYQVKLKASGFEVLVANEGAKGLELAKKRKTKLNSFRYYFAAN